MKNTLAVTFAIVALTPLTITGTPSYANTAEDSPEAVQCASPESGEGVLQWSGSPSKEVEAAALRAASLVEANPKDLTAAEYCVTYSGVRVLAPAISGATAHLKTLKAEFPNVTFVAEEAPQSLAALQAAAGSAAALLPSSGNFSVAPNPRKGEIVITGEESKRPRGLGKQIGPVRIAWNNRQVHAAKSSTRYADSAPFYAGAHIVSEGSMCSTGPRIRINGTYMMLTAGHCPGGTHYTGGGLPVGNRFTTSYPGNADIYGDWKLLSGKSYSDRVWNGGLYDSTSHPGAGINFTPLPYGHRVCTSGRTTGQLCRFWVKETNTVEKIGGVTVNHQTTLIVDDQSTSNPEDCTGFQGGDSGGPAYYNNGSGSMIYAGLVQGTTWQWYLTQKRCQYHITQLNGVRAWNSTAAW